MYGGVPPDAISPVIAPSLFPQVLDTMAIESALRDGVGETVIEIVLVSDSQPPASITEMLYILLLVGEMVCVLLEPSPLFQL